MKAFILNLICYLTRIQYNYKGKYRIIKWLIARPNLFANGIKYKIKIANLGIMEVNPSDFVDRYLFVTGNYENDLELQVTQILNKNDNFLDIGANIGYFSLVASKIVGSMGKVFAFEPSPKTILRLEKNIKINNIKNIIVYPNAVSNEIGSIEFMAIAEANSGMSSLRKIKGCSPILVNTLTIDSLLEILPTIKLIKMDIEGAEGLALKGMLNLIERDRPYILLELTDSFLKQLDSSANDVIQRLSDLNYEICNISGESIKITNVPLDQCNILCKPYNIA